MGQVRLLDECISSFLMVFTYFLYLCYGLPILPCIIILNAAGKHRLGIFGDAF